MTDFCEATRGKKRCPPIVRVVFSAIGLALIVACIAIARLFGLSYGWSLLTGFVGGHLAFGATMRLLFRVLARPNRERPSAESVNGLRPSP